MNQHRIFADYHTHTEYSHGKGTPAAVVEAALNRGLKAVAISEHAAGHMIYGVRGRELDRLHGEIARLRIEHAGRIDVLRGAELNVTGFGTCDCPENRDEYDVIIIGYHKGIAPVNRFAAHIWGESMFKVMGDPRRNAESLLVAAESCRANIISHPNLYIRVDIPYLAECARQLGIALEINSSHVSLTADEIKLIARKGCKLVIGSDAHTPERVGDFEKAACMADKCHVWDSIINAVSSEG